MVGVTLFGGWWCVVWDRVPQTEGAVQPGAAEPVADVGRAITPNVFHLVVIHGGQDGAPGIAFDLEAAYTVGGGGNAGQIGLNHGQQICIGAYSDVVGVNGRQGDWWLGKLAFHDHTLSQTERSLLYHSMFG